jgi:hypothetical protein
VTPLITGATTQCDDGATTCAPGYACVKNTDGTCIGVVYSGGTFWECSAAFSQSAFAALAVTVAGVAVMMV